MYEENDILHLLSHIYILFSLLDWCSIWWFGKCWSSSSFYSSWTNQGIQDQLLTEHCLQHFRKLRKCEFLNYTFCDCFCNPWDWIVIFYSTYFKLCTVTLLKRINASYWFNFWMVELFYNYGLLLQYPPRPTWINMSKWFFGS